MFWLTCSVIVAIAATILAAWLYAKGYLHRETRKTKEACLNTDVIIGLSAASVLATMLAPLTLGAFAIAAPLYLIFQGANRVFKA